MKNSGDSSFSVNVGFSDTKISELKKLILSFIKKVAEEGIVSNYRKDNNSRSGLAIGGNVEIGNPTDDELSNLLDFVKIAPEKPADDHKETKLITLSLPLGKM